MKRFIIKLLRQLNIEIDFIGKPGTTRRPLSNMKTFLFDLRERGLVCKHILDVGANKSFWSRETAKVYPSASYYLIEPQEEMRSFLQGFCNEHEESKYFIAGAGKKNEVLDLNVYDSLAGSTFMGDENSNTHVIGKRAVDVVSIDSLIETNQIPDTLELVKLDIQGFELEALKGATKLFGKTEVFILETSMFEYYTGLPVFSEVVNFMLDRDYVVYDLPGYNRRPLDGALGQLDICFVKKDGFLRKNSSWD